MGKTVQYTLSLLNKHHVQGVCSETESQIYWQLTTEAHVQVCQPALADGMPAEVRETWLLVDEFVLCEAQRALLKLLRDVDAWSSSQKLSMSASAYPQSESEGRPIGSMGHPLEVILVSDEQHLSCITTSLTHLLSVAPQVHALADTILKQAAMLLSKFWQWHLCAA